MPVPSFLTHCAGCGVNKNDKAQPNRAKKFLSLLTDLTTYFTPMPKNLLLALNVALLLSSCATAPRNTAYQTSTIDALLAGVFEGDFSCRNLLKHGDFGIGTFDSLDGEMLIVDGKLFQVKGDGTVHTPSPSSIKTPFATVCRFTPEQRFALPPNSTFADIEKVIDEKAPNQNLFEAIKITGRFKTMHTRSVPRQPKPYPPLSQITANQPEFHLTDVKGTIVGFRAPAFVKGVNVPGYHLHFVDVDRTCGGHILGFEIIEADCEIDTLHQFFMRLPKDTEAFAKTDLSKDRSSELHVVEKGTKKSKAAQ